MGSDSSAPAVPRKPSDVGIVNLARELKSFLEKKGERRKKAGKWGGWCGTTLLFPLLFSHCTREIASAWWHDNPPHEGDVVGVESGQRWVRRQRESVERVQAI